MNCSSSWDADVADVAVVEVGGCGSIIVVDDDASLGGCDVMIDDGVETACIVDNTDNEYTTMLTGFTYVAGESKTRLIR